jgi:hypothetical protein
MGMGLRSGPTPPIGGKTWPRLGKTLG